jgi:probable HAF family extracellular repeat protein
MARVTDVITTTIIPVVPFVPPPDPNTPWGRATAINEAGVVAGWKMSPNEIYAFTWKDGVMTSLGTAYPARNENMQAFFRPVAINRFGEIVGPNAAGQAVVWRGGVLTRLVEPDVAYVEATDINDKGQIVGWGFFHATHTLEAYLWDNGTVTRLGTLGGSLSVATAINNHGQVVGYSRMAGDGATHAFLWERGVMIDLGTIEGGSSEANGINDKGEIVGLASQLCAQSPFIWRKGVMSWLLPGPASCATRYVIADISDAGHVVGDRALGGSEPRAFVWRDGVLLIVGSSQTYATAVNSRGEIAGYEDSSVGLPGAYLWTVGRHGP